MSVPSWLRLDLHIPTVVHPLPDSPSETSIHPTVMFRTLVPFMVERYKEFSLPHDSLFRVYQPSRDPPGAYVTTLQTGNRRSGAPTFEKSPRHRPNPPKSHSTKTFVGPRYLLGSVLRPSSYTRFPSLKRVVGTLDCPRLLYRRNVSIEDIAKSQKHLTQNKNKKISTNLYLPIFNLYDVKSKFY